MNKIVLKISIIVLSIIFTLTPGLNALSMEKSETLAPTPVSEITEKRFYPRYKLKDLKYPVLVKITTNAPEVKKVIDISRGGAGFEHDNMLSPGDIIPVDIEYKQIKISTRVKITSSSSTRAGGEFIDIDQDARYKLLHLSILIDADNDLLNTRLRKG